MTQPRPFKEKPAPAKPGLLARIFLAPQREAAHAEVRSLLATTPPRDVYRAQLDATFRKHRIGPNEQRRMLNALWKEALTVLAGDDLITDEEAAYLTDLRATFDIDEDTAMRYEAEVLHPKYEELVRRSIADGHLSAHERRQLASLASALRLSSGESETIYRKSAEQLLEATLDTAIADERLSPTEFREYSLLAKRLGVNPRLDEGTRSRLHRYALLWRIENGEMPTVAVPINLQRGEVCHLRGGAAWHEMRTRTERVSYSGTSVSIPIVKGVRYRVGSYKPRRVTREELTQIDVGEFFITSKRLVFDGPEQEHRDSLQFSARGNAVFGRDKAREVQRAQPIPVIRR